MAQTASIVTGKVHDFFKAPDTGLGAVVGNLALNAGMEVTVVRPASVVQQNTPIGLMEKARAVKYPAVHIYVDRVQNLLTEKFRSFSGKVRTVAEVRVSQDRIDGLEDQVRLYVDGVTQILDTNRGTWGEGMFFAGLYEVKYEPVQHGGQNFLQIAKVSFEVDLSS
jgi:hypothetical protein